MVYCCVPFCKSSGRKGDSTISFHEFPCDNSLRAEWLRVISRKNFVVNSNSPSSVVCSRHFKPEDYSPGLKLKKLKKGAIPSVFPPACKVPKSSQKRRIQRKSDQLTKNQSKKRKCKGKLPERKKLQVGVPKTVGKEQDFTSRQLTSENEMPPNTAEGNPDLNKVCEAELLLHLANSSGVTHSNLTTLAPTPNSLNDLSVLKVIQCSTSPSTVADNLTTSSAVAACAPLSSGIKIQCIHPTPKMIWLGKVQQKTLILIPSHSGRKNSLVTKVN